MKKVGFLFVIILFFAVPLTGCAFGRSSVDYSIDMTPRMVTLSQANAEDVVSAVSVASVAIRATSNKTEAIGSGVAVASGGYVVTNNHVIEGAKSLTLYLANNDTTSASVIWRDADQDLAILKAGVDLPYVEMSASSNLKKGQEIDPNNLKNILDNEMYMKAKNKALSILSKASQSEKQIRQKLSSDYEEDTIEKVIEFLQKYKFVDDEDLASRIVNTNVNLNKYGKNK